MQRVLYILVTAWLVILLLGKPFEPADLDDKAAGLNGQCCPCCVLDSRKDGCEDDCCEGGGNDESAVDD